MRRYRRRLATVQRSVREQQARAEAHAEPTPEYMTAARLVRRWIDTANARGIDCYTIDDPSFATCPTIYIHRDAHAFLMTLPVDTVVDLMNGEDIAAVYPDHARAWSDPASLTRDEWRALCARPRQWGFVLPWSLIRRWVRPDLRPVATPPPARTDRHD